MKNQETGNYREALRKAETNLNNLRRGFGCDETTRLRRIHNQEKVVHAMRRLVNIGDKPKTEAVQPNVSYIQ